MNEKKYKLDGFEALRYAIVMCAIRDYRRATRYIEKHKDENSNYTAQMRHLKSDCESFFNGSWYEMIFDMDSKMIMDIAPKLKFGFRDKGGKMRDVY